MSYWCTDHIGNHEPVTSLMVSNSMEAEFRLNFQDLREAQILHLRTSRLWRTIREIVIPTMLLVSSLSLIVVWFLVAGPLTKLIFLVPLWFQGGFAFLVAHPVWSPFNIAEAKKAAETNDKFRVVHRVEVDVNGLSLQKTSSLETQPWSLFGGYKETNKMLAWASLRGYRETQNLYLLYNSPRDIEILPKRAFSPENLAHLEQLVSEKATRL